LDEVMGWFRERLETTFVISGKPERDVLWEYPLSAIREAVTNVLCHRDYTGHAHSQIRLYDDRLEIWNAGGLPPSLTPDLLLREHDSIPRNRKIAEAFFYAGLIERWGSDNPDG
jgi:ATP-dependent DNA helicase RecG